MELSEIELRAWLSNVTTLKVLKILKSHRETFNKSIISGDLSGDDLYRSIGRCRAYDDIIELIEETATSQGDLELILENYIEIRNNEH